MRRRARAGFAIAALALAALSSCGASGASRTTGSAESADRGAEAAPGSRRAEADRRLRQPGLRDRRPGRPEAALRRRAGRQDPGHAGRPAPGQAVPRHLRAGLLRRRARAALGRLPARLRGQRALLRLLRRQGRQHPDRRIPAPLADPRRGRLAPQRDRDRPPGQLEPQRRPAAVPRRRPLLRHRRRRLPPATRRTTPRTRRACWASCCGSIPAPPAAGPTRFPPPTPSSAGRAATRSTATGCATRSASPSTRSARGRRGSRSATSARTASRRSTTRPSPPPRARTSAGTPSRASPPTAKKTAARPTRAAP